MNNLTDRSFWKEYWSNYIYEKVPARSEFDDYFPEGMSQGHGRTCIEIGGFPARCLFISAVWDTAPRCLTSM